MRARISREVSVLNVVGIQRVSLAIAFTVAELLDGIAGHLGGDWDMCAAADITGVFVLRVASEGIGAGRMEGKGRAVVLVGYGPAVLVHRRVGVAVVDGFGQVLDAGIFGDGV